jgi:hypothetical protein
MSAREFFRRNFLPAETAGRSLFNGLLFGITTVGLVFAIATLLKNLVN